MPTIDLSGVHQQWLDQYCNKDAAFSLGAEEAQNGEEHSSARFGNCSEGAGSLMRSYTNGYNSVPKSQTSTSTPTIYNPFPANEFFRCTLEPFTDEYTAGSSNMGKAKHLVIEKCRKDHHEMHCSDPKCTKL